MNERWAKSDDQALELDGLGTPVPLPWGQRVRVQTIWGYEGGTIMDVKHGDADVFPLAQVRMDKGDTIYINVARCTPEEVCVACGGDASEGPVASNGEHWCGECYREGVTS